MKFRKLAVLLSVIIFISGLNIQVFAAVQAKAPTAAEAKAPAPAEAQAETPTPTAVQAKAPVEDKATENADGENQDEEEPVDPTFISKSDRAIITRSLLTFSNADTCEMNGEMNIITTTNFLGEITVEEETNQITITYADGEMSFEAVPNGSQLAFDENIQNFFSGYMGGVERNMLKNLEIINDFTEDDVRFIDVKVMNLSDIGDIVNDMKDDIINAAAAKDGIDEEMAKTLAEILAPLFDTAKISGIEYLRINTETRTVTGIGLIMEISMEFDFLDTPISIISESEAFFEVTYPTDAVEQEE